ncbi:exporter of polyketide antibiotics [Kibdelosporangium lantanae]
MTGTVQLIRLALRRDRITLPAWITVLVLTAVSAAAATIDLYPTAESRLQAAANSNGTPALVALYGRIYDPTSIGALSMFKMSAFGAMLVAVLAMFTVVRHTRTEEETGRLELLGATVVGRYAPLTAALVVAVGANVMLGGLTAAGLVSVGLPGPGALAFGASWAAVGIVFAAVAALAAQLTRSARAANGISAIVLGAAYLVRAVGDASVPWLSWLSPIGWGQQTRPFAGDRWWVLLVLVVFAGFVVVGAYALVERRDMGAGVLPDRPGRATAAEWVHSPLGLAWRLNRGSLLAWLGAYVVLGAVLGNIVSNIGGFLDSPQARDMILKLGGVSGIVDAFLATEMAFLGIFTTVYGIQVLLRMRTEETAARLAPVLAATGRRSAWLGSYLVVAFTGVTLLMACGGLAAGFSLSAQTGDMSQVGRLVAAAVAQLPAVWVVLGLVVALFGLLPRWVTAAWALLVGFLLLGELGPLLGLPGGVMDLSPYAHMPRLPGGVVAVAPIALSVVVAAGLVLLGAVTFRRRDVS